MSPDIEDTLVAIASPPGGALRGVIRMSGPATIPVWNACFETAEGEALVTPARSMVVPGSLKIASHSRAVEGDLYLWADGRSYTRQLSAEFHTIGSPPLLEMMIQTLSEHGARAALPGEFTMRAFLAGRLDLTQAEAVLGVIDSNDRVQVDAALKQLAGGLTQPLNELREGLVTLLADVEAGLDFVEDDITFIDEASVREQLQKGLDLVRELEHEMRERQISQDEFRVVLTGEPNVGKSSLLNAMVGERAAIVANQSGTTRDYVEYHLPVGGRSCVLIDTAGRFEGQPERALDPIDAVAQQAAQTQLAESHLQLYCIDAHSLGQAHLPTPSADQILIVTKCDLCPDTPIPAGAIPTSAVHQTGIPEVMSAIAERTLSELAAKSEVVAATAIRCREMLASASSGLNRARDAVEGGAGEEIVAFEIRGVLQSLGEVVGAIYTDDILDRVFSRFCIGK